MTQLIGPLHCIVILGIVAGSAWWLQSHLERPPPVRIVVGMTCGPALVLVAALLSVHNCARGQPIQQWLFPGTMLCACWLFAEHQPSKVWVVSGIWFLSVALSMHYAHVVHSEAWIGIPLTYDDSGAVINAASEWHTPISGLYTRIE